MLACFGLRLKCLLDLFWSQLGFGTGPGEGVTSGDVVRAS